MPQQGAAPLAPLTRLSLHTHKNSIPAFGVCTIFAGFHFIREVIPIAIYHCNISIVSRGKGKSAVAAAAYRSGEKLTNEWDGMTHDYTRKGGVVHTEIMLPPHAPPSFSDRSTLWNSVELYEKAGNAQLAREIDAALPIESVSYTHLFPFPKSLALCTGRSGYAAGKEKNGSEKQ